MMMMQKCTLILVASFNQCTVMRSNTMQVQAPGYLKCLAIVEAKDAITPKTVIQLAPPALLCPPFPCSKVITPPFLCSKEFPVEG